MKNAQKTLFTTAFIYLVIGMLSGVFYREVTKFKEFPVDNATQLSTLHTHLLVLGFIVPLVVLALDKLYTLAGSKQFTWFFYLYNIGLVITLVMMTVRGWLQVLAGSPLEQTPELSKGMDAGIAGMAGIGHILLAVSLVLLMVRLGARINTMQAQAKQVNA